MEVKVFGLGYVGTVTALCLSELGFDVVGIEPIERKVKELQEGRLHLYETGVEELFSSDEVKKRFKVEQSLEQLGEGKQVILICVGTPMEANGAINLIQVQEVFKEVSSLIQRKEKGETLILLRSTVPPQTCRNLYDKYLKNLTNLDFAFFPEFLREGQAVKDFKAPRLVCFGHHNEEGRDVQEKWADFFSKLPGIEKSKWGSFESTEMIKYAQNSYNALRVAFANEIGSVASSFDVPLDELSELMIEHNRNEPAGMYLKPGFCFGGPCLTKELEGITWLGRKSTHELPLLNEILISNDKHFERYLNTIENLEAQRILFCGVTFKEQTDDLRNSLVLKLVERLRTGPQYLKKKTISIVDRPIVLDSLRNSNWDKHHKVNLVRLDELTLEDYDLVIKGPFPLEESVLRASGVKTLSLGFDQEDCQLPF